MKKPAILIMTVTLMMIGILVIDFHLKYDNSCILIPDDYSELLESVRNLESNIVLIGEDLPFPDSVNHQVIKHIDELYKTDNKFIDFIIINESNHGLSISEIHTLKQFNQQDISLIFVGLSNDDLLNINSSLMSNYPYGVGVIKMNTSSFEQGIYEIYEPTTNDPELKLYNVLRMMVSK